MQNVFCTGIIVPIKRTTEQPDDVHREAALSGGPTDGVTLSGTRTVDGWHSGDARHARGPKVQVRGKAPDQSLRQKDRASKVIKLSMGTERPVDKEVVLFARSVRLWAALLFCLSEQMCIARGETER